MIVPRCPNCSFALVLLERRLKYKCAKCSRLFPQKEIDDKTFRQWNVKQRELDEHNLKLENRKTKLSDEEKKKRQAEYRKKNKDKIIARSENWHINNKKRHISNCKKYYLKNRKKMLERNRRYKAENLNKAKVYERILYWRKRQLRLTQQELRNSRYHLNFDGSSDSFPTYGLSELLHIT